jgi:hypothetical protein
MGIVLAFLAAIGLVGLLFGFLGGVLPARGTPLLWLESLAHLVASLLGMVGGYRMAGDDLRGKDLAIYSLALNVGAEVVLGFSHLFGHDLLLLLGWGVLYYLTAISRPDAEHG